MRRPAGSKDDTWIWGSALLALGLLWVACWGRSPACTRCPGAGPTLSAPAGGLGQTTLLPLKDLPPGWGGGPVSLPATDLVIASAQGDQSYLTQVTFSAADLSALTPAEVRLTGNGTVTVGDVSSAVCGSQTT